jgi:Uncharacterized protein conserved in bacteria
MKTICFTGRRPKDLCGYTSSKYHELLVYLDNLLETEFYSKGVRTFISGGAQGFDQLAFWVVNKLKERHPDVKNVVYVPFKGQDGRWLANGLFSQHQYQTMLSLADDVKYLYVINNSNFGQVVKALTDRNHDMVNASDAVIALYPKDDYETVKGGTAECMRYAKSQNVKVYQLKYEITANGVHPTTVVEIN